MDVCAQHKPVPRCPSQSGAQSPAVKKIEASGKRGMENLKKSPWRIGLTGCNTY
jgi:hypothetical protein